MSHDEETKKTFTIVVNAKEKTWNKKEISYDEVVLLAFPDAPAGVVITYTVEFERAEGHKSEGSLVQGGPPAKVKEGMIFSVTETSRS